MSGTIRVKVRGYHLDMYGHVNHARYVEFLEEARWALIETSGSVGAWGDRGLGFVVVRLEIDYRRGAVLDDELEVRSRVERLGGRSGIIRQEIVRVGDGAPVVDAAVTFVVIDTATGKAVALEGDLREALGG